MLLRLIPLRSSPRRRLATLNCTTSSRTSNFLVFNYKIELGRYSSQGLAVGPATNYLRILLNLVSDRFKACGTSETKLFLTALDSYANTEAALWFKSVKRKMVRAIFQRSMSNGEEMDKSETPLYLGLEHEGNRRRIVDRLQKLLALHIRGLYVQANTEVPKSIKEPIRSAAASQPVFGTIPPQRQQIHRPSSLFTCAAAPLSPLLAAHDHHSRGPPAATATHPAEVAATAPATPPRGYVRRCQAVMCGVAWKWLCW